MKRTVLFCFIVLAMACKDEGEKPLPYLDAHLSTEARVEDLLSRMTMKERIGMLKFDSDSVPRLGIPRYNWWNECLHGVARAGEATVFPQAIGMAATFDENFVKTIASTIADEARAKHTFFKDQGVREIYTGLTFWTPNINIFRDPRWGRGQETYGEDPFLTSRMGVNFIQGLQGDDPNYLKVVATAKHFAVHNGPEKSRHSDDFDVSEKDLYETYLPAFEAAVKEGQVQSVMCAYNAFRSEPCCGNSFLLQSVLRDQWGFDGYIVSDCGAISDFYREGAHGYVETPAEAVAEAIKSGTDLNCGSEYSFENVDEALQKGLVDTVKVNASVKRLLSALLKLGMFDPDGKVPYAQIPASEIASEKNRELAHLAANKSLVLLKNEHKVLPLSKELKSVAIIGPNANSIASLYGNYNGISKKPVDVVSGVKAKLGEDAEVYFASGSPYVDGLAIFEHIPDQLFFTDTTLTAQGLKGRYFDNANFEGDPAVEQIDSNVNFRWLDKMPIPGKFKTPFSVVWEGYLVPDQTATYRFDYNGKVMVDGEEVKKDIHLTANRTYTIVVQSQGNQLYGESSTPSSELKWANLTKDYESEAMAMAERAEVIIFCGGLSPRIEGEEMPDMQLEGFDRGDRTLIKLPDAQERLLKKLHRLEKKMIYVNISGSGVAFNWAAENVPGIVQAFYPGEQGGAAVADVLFGDYNPAGRLPVTFYKSVGDLGDFTDYGLKGKTYRYFTGEPLYPFGYGLSYTRFSYTEPKIQKNNEGGIDILVKLTNVGQMDGDEVAQLYLGHRNYDNQPLQSLVAFQRVHLTAGEDQVLRFSLTPEQLTYINEHGERLPIKGSAELTIGSGFDPEFGGANLIKKEIVL